MRSLLLKRFLQSSFSQSCRSTSTIAAAAAASSTLNPSPPFSLLSRRHAVSAPMVDEDSETIVFPRENPEISYGLNWALAGKGVIVKNKAFCNLKKSELEQKGAKLTESLSGLPVHVRGNVLEGADKVSKGQFSKLLKHVTSHISSVSSIFVHDGAVGLSSLKCDAKVRVISDCPSAALSLSEFLWSTPSRAISHDTCPITVYAATSISASAGDVIDLKAQGTNGFIVADIDQSLLILCGKAFSDRNGTKAVLAALSGPIISARGGLPLSARLLSSGDSVVLLFAPEELIQGCSDMLVSADGVIVSPQGVAPFFQTRDSGAPNLYKLPAAVILATSDSSGVIPSVSKLSPGQAAYHFLAGYQDGKFVPAYGQGLSAVNPLELAKALLGKLEYSQISSFLINTSQGDKRINGKDLLKIAQSTLSNNIPPLELKGGGDLQKKFKSFLSGKFPELPEEFSF